MRTKLHIPAITLVVCLAIGGATTALVYRQEQDVRRETRMRTLEEFSHRTRERVNGYVALLTATAAYVGTRPTSPLPRERFLSYVKALGDLEALSGVQGIGLSLLVPPERTYELRRRLAIEHGGDAKLWPEVSDAPFRSAIVLLAPEDERNLAAIGYDMYSEPKRRAAMDRARDKGVASLTAPLSLVQEIDEHRQIGTLIYVYFDGASGAEGKGYIYSPMRMGQLFDGLTSTALGTYLRVEDIAEPVPTLYESRELGRIKASDMIEASLEVEVGGRQWRMTSYSDPAAGRQFAGSPVAYMTGVAAILLSLSLAAAAHGIAGSVRQSRRLAEAQARRMAETDLHLREMSHRLKNALTRVTAMARQAAHHAGTKEEFVTSFNRRLQAMAAAQDLLTRSAADGAELRDLISVEIAQIHGEVTELARISGPSVILTPAQTQALGLSMHELATNALKYGAGAVPGANIDITWTLRREEGRSVVDLLWEERTGIPVSPPAVKGFGSRLLESCIKLELGGELSHEYHAEGMRVRIKFDMAS